jgi:hypothetical protein
MDMATIILSIVFVVLVRAGWLAPPPTQHRGGAPDLFGSSWSGLGFLRFFFFFLFKKKISVNSLHNFHHLEKKKIA